MRVALLGCGMMGASAARLLAEGDAVTELVVADSDAQRAHSLAQELDAAPVELDVRDRDGARALLARVDAAALTLPWPATRAVIEALRERDVPIVSIARPPDQALPWLRRVRGPQMLLPMGLEPGLTEVLARRCAERVGVVRELHVRCGGVPIEPRPPLGYQVLFGGNRLPIQPRHAYAIEHGMLVRAPRFSGIEETRVEGVGVLEAYHDGMVPWLAEDPIVGAAAAVSQKTLRWPGFGATIASLDRLGLLAETPIEVDGETVIPRRVVETVLLRLLDAAGPPRDVTILRVRAVGSSQTSEALVLERGTDEMTGMARVTAGALIAGLHTLLAGRVAGAGWLRPNEALAGPAGDALLAELARYGILVRERLLVADVRPS